MHGIIVRRLVAKIGCQPIFAGATRTDSDGTSDAGFDLDGPVNAAGLPVDGEKVALRISDVEAPSNDNGLRASGTRPGETERPFQMEARNIIRGNACNFGRLKTRIRDRDAPTVPGRSVQALAERLRAIGAKCGLGNGVGEFATQRLAGKIFRERATLGAASLRGLRLHISLLERLQNLLRSQLVQNVAAGSTRIGIRAGLMTGSTIAFEERGAVLSA